MLLSLRSIAFYYLIPGLFSKNLLPLASLLGRLKYLAAVIAYRACIIRGQLCFTGFKVAANGADIAFLFLVDSRYIVFKFFRPMVAERAGELLRQFASLVEVSADLAVPAFDLRRRRIFLGLDVGVVIGVCAGLTGRKDLCFNDIRNIQHLRSDILNICHDAG